MYANKLSDNICRFPFYFAISMIFISFSCFALFFSVDPPNLGIEMLRTEILALFSVLEGKHFLKIIKCEQIFSSV